MNVDTENVDIIFIRRERVKFSILKLTRNYFKVVAYIYIYIYISRGRIILSVRARVIEFSNYLFHRLVIPVISFTSENNNEVLDAPAPVYYPDLSSSELVSEPYIGSVQSNVITGLITGITRKKFHVGG